MVWTFDTVKEKWRTSLVENTGVQSNFYSIETNEGHDDSIEKLLSDIETDAEGPYTDLLQGRIPQGQARANFSVFLATLYLRTPAVIEAVAGAHADLMNLDLQMLTSSPEAFAKASREIEQETGKGLGDRRKLHEFVTDRTRYTMHIDRKVGLRIIGAADEIAPLLYKRRWVVCTAIEGFFISSDHPIYRWVPEDTRHPIYGDGGFKNPRAVITFPLSPGKMLLMAGPDVEEGTFFLDAESVYEANEARAHGAVRQIYSPFRDEDMAAMAMKHRNAVLRMGRLPSDGRPEIKVVRKMRGRDKGPSSA